MGIAAFAWPIRVDAPAARTTAEITRIAPEILNPARQHG